MTRALIRTIHVGCRELGIDADTRHDMQERLTGKASLSDMTEPELRLVIDHLKDRGFTVKSGRRRPAAAKDGRLRLIHVLWSKLGEAGVLRDPTRKGLNAFIRARFEKSWGSVPVDVDQMRDNYEIDDVIQALKDWGRREDIDFDWGAHRK